MMKKLLSMFNLQMFAEPNTNLTTDTAATTGNDLSPGMRVFYARDLIANASPELVHNQFGQKKPIPKNGGKTIKFRKFSPLPKLLTPLQEGVTPDGQKLNMEEITAEVKQYGGYVTLSDILQLTATDDNILEATKLLSSQAGRTLDTITRDIINAGTVVQYGDSLIINARHLLNGGEEDAGDNHYLTVDAIDLAVTTLKNALAKKIDGHYVGIVHPNVSYDLKKDKQWRDIKTYSDPNDIYEGEIGTIGGVRFVETTEAKIFTAPDLSENCRNLTVNGAVNGNTTVSVAEKLSDDDIAGIVDRYVLIGAAKYRVEKATANSLTLDEAVTAADKTVIYPGEAGAKGRAVYSTLILGADAYGVTDIEGGGLEVIVKQLGSGGTTDALNQRSTVGWKATETAERLVEGYMVRIETAATLKGKAN